MVFKLNYKIATVILAALLVFACFTINETIKTSTSIDKIDLPVIMYHHILKAKQGDYIVSPTQLEQDLMFIRDNGYTTITALQLASYLNDGTPLPQKPIMITFDDGYESVYAYGLPLLKKYDMKAIISVIGKHTDIFSSPDETKHLNYSHASWDQLREMQQSGVFSIENHTYDMHSNTDTSRYGSRIKKGESLKSYTDEMSKDVIGLSDQIEREIGVRPLVFAYPFGALCKESREFLEGSGFSLLLTCEEKVNHIEANSPMPASIKRFNRAAHYSTEDFFAKLS